MSIFKGDFNSTGINEIDIDSLSKKWSYLWVLLEWEMDNSWRLIKYKRKDSPHNNSQDKYILRPSKGDYIKVKINTVG